MIIKKHIVYPGIEEPQSIKEIKVEIFGLKNAIKIAEELISRYEQVLAIAELKQEEMSNVSTQSISTDDQGKE